MTVSEFVAQLHQLGVELWAEGEQVRYSVPKDVLTAVLRAEMARRKMEILQFLRETNGTPCSAPLPILRVPRYRELPLSFAQQRIWFIDKFDPDSPAYNIPVAIRLTGALHVTALERSLNEIIKRHEILRTTCSIVGEQPVQVIAPALTLTLPVVDIGRLQQGEREAHLLHLAAEEARRIFDLTKGPLLRATLLRLSTDEHVLLLITHHFVADGWSMRVFLRELSALYEAFSTGMPASLPDLPIQYADFAQGQRQRLQDKALEEELAYWKKQLADAPRVLELPMDRPRPAVQSYRGASQSIQLPKDLSERLKELSRLEGVTLFMTLLAALKVLLHRYTGQTDIVVGTAVSNRNRIETEALMGPFANNLVLRTDLSGNPTFQGLLGRIREVAGEAYAHQDLPFEKLLEELRPERDLSYTPLFQVMFILHQQTLEENLELPGLSLSMLPIEMGTARFDLGLSMADGRRGLSGSLEYSTDLFDAATIDRMLGHLRTLLEGIAANPNQRLSDLPILTGAEERQLLVEWNETKKDYPKDQCIHELFEEQAARTPDAVAVVFEEEQLTYRELNFRANQLAHYLRKLGVGPEVLVGICVERSLEMVIGLLGILKAGGAYVPLDPTYPRERLAFMLEDAELSVLLTQRRLLQALPVHLARLVCLDEDWEAISRERDYNPSVGVTGEGLAYVIYTSGSTGRPKGVAVTHKAVNRLLINTNYVDLGPTDVVAQVSNCSFDAATFEIWGTLLHGARLVVITTDVAVSPNDLAKQIDQKKISALFLTTALFNQMARECPAAFKNLRHLLFGGEAVDPRWVREILEHGPPKRLLHVYGPTETTTFASWHPVENVPEGATTIPIGRPIANTEIYLLDRYLLPVPVGVVGELCIGGDGLARGYLNQPELTAEKFITNPFSDNPKARLYRTGDLARYLPDGNIEFVGRVDNQVKIRGFRVEPGEIETVLGRHPAVRQTLVLVHNDIDGGKRLLAYVVPSQESKPTITDLRSFLKQRLPDYMTPSSFVFLDALPLTPNGKVDRRALPAPDQSRPELGQAFVAPRTPVEETLVGIWIEVLKLEEVGIHDNFFELGGHSLLATQVMSRLRTAFQVELPLRCLFESPTVAGLTNAIQRAKDSGAEHPTPPISPLPRELHRVELSSPATSQD